MEVSPHTRRMQPVQKIPAISKHLKIDSMMEYISVYSIIITDTYSCAGVN